ncbi:MAG: HAMP domain-containing histidine kinase [Spirochaetales bacterium]|nr:HAMP domain-containing histidine kinase [Spirochaetales bacterium]
MDANLKDLKNKWKISLDLLAEEVEAPVGFIVRFERENWEVFVTKPEGEALLPRGLQDSVHRADHYLSSQGEGGVFFHSLEHIPVPRTLRPLVSEKELTHYCGLTVTYRSKPFGILFLGGRKAFEWDDRREIFFRRFKTIMENDLEMFADKERFKEELIEAREEILRSSLKKTDFLKNMTQELTHPINAIAGYSRLIAKSAGSDLQGYADVIDENRNHLQETLLSIIQVSRGEELPGLHREELPVLPLMDDLHRSHSVSMPQGVQLVTRIRCPSDFTLYTDGRWVKQILSHLLVNAEQNTNRGEIKIECRLNKEKARFDFTVSDTGCGIPRDKQDSLFRRPDGKDSQNGLQPGLALSHSLSVKLGGTLTVRSEQGRGSVFTLALPLGSPYQASA